MSEFLYKIRHKGTGLFSTGGSHPGWSKRGKGWWALGHLKNHLALVKQEHSRMRWGRTRTTPNAYEDAEVVTLEVVERKAEHIDTMLAEHEAARAAKQAKKNEKERVRLAAQAAKDAVAKEQRERSQLAVLQAKYPQ